MLRARLLRYAGPLFGIGVFVLALYALRREMRGARLGDVVRQVESIPASQLLLAVALTAGSFFVLSGYDALSLRYVRRRLHYRRIALASFLNYAFSHALGFPLVVGGSTRYRLYSGWGLSAVQVAKVVGFASLTFWLGVLTMGGIVLVDADPSIARILRVPAAAVRPIGLTALAVVAAYLGWTLTGRRLVRLREWRLRRPSVRLAAGQLLVACVDWLFVAGSLYVLLPEPVRVDFPVFLGIFLLAFVAGLVSSVPAGLGVFETIVLLLLPDRVPDTQVLGALLAWRGVYYLLPLTGAALLLGAHEVLRSRRELSRMTEMFGRWAPALAPQVFAMTTVLGGAFLLLSVATPVEADRLAALARVVPLPVIELAHLMAGIAGIVLVLVAVGVQRRLASAHRIALGALVIGAACAILKGMDRGAASALAIVLLALAPAHRQFDRRASFLAEPLTAGWITTVSIAVIGTAFVGALAQASIDVRDSASWLSSTIAGESSRYLRTMAAIVATLFIFVILRRRHPLPHPAALPSAAELARARRIALESRDTYSQRALEGDAALLLAAGDRGFVAFRMGSRSWIALGDPVGTAAELSELAWAFRDLCDGNRVWTVFLLATRARIPLYVDLGLTLLAVAEEARIDLADWTPIRADPPVRDALATITSTGASFGVLPLSAVRMRARSSVRTSLASSALPDDTPVAVVHRGDEVVAAAPLRIGAGREEASIASVHIDDGEPLRVIDVLCLETIAWTRERGMSSLVLGLIPLVEIEGGVANPLRANSAESTFGASGRFSDVASLRAFVDRFRPEWESRFLAASGDAPLAEVLEDVAALDTPRRL